MWGLVAAAVFIGCIVLANWLVTHYGIVSVGFGLYAPAAVYAAGLAFTARDFTQMLLGKTATIYCIVIGCAVSYYISPTFAEASAVAFGVSELLDMSVFTAINDRRRRTGEWFIGAVVASNVVGVVVDSVIFLWLAFHSLEFLKGQIVGKLTMTLAAVAAMYAARLVYQRRQVAR